MVSVFDPAILLTAASLLVLFGVGWRYHWGSLPPVRTLLLVGVALFWLAYSLTQVAALVRPPYDDVGVALAVVLFFGGATACWRWWRAR